MTEIIPGTDFTIFVSYSADVNAASFNNTDFHTDPSIQFPDTITQADTNQLLLTFISPIGGETGITYDGATPGVLSPQSISY